MSDWQTQVDKLLEDYEGITHERYAVGLASFRAWYLQSYSDEPDATLLTDDEVRDYRVYLTGVKGNKAATINAYLVPIRAIVRAQGRTLKVKDVKQVQAPVERLSHTFGDTTPCRCSDVRQTLSPPRCLGSKIWQPFSASPALAARIGTEKTSDSKPKANTLARQR